MIEQSTGPCIYMVQWSTCHLTSRGLHSTLPLAHYQWSSEGIYAWAQGETWGKTGGETLWRDRWFCGEMAYCLKNVWNSDIWIKLGDSQKLVETSKDQNTCTCQKADFCLKSSLRRQHGATGARGLLAGTMGNMFYLSNACASIYEMGFTFFNGGLQRASKWHRCVGEVALGSDPLPLFCGHLISNAACDFHSIWFN